jgi:hypothetical protein
MSRRSTTFFDVLLQLAMIFFIFPLMLILIGLAKIEDPWYRNKPHDTARAGQHEDR